MKRIALLFSLVLPGLGFGCAQEAGRATPDGTQPDTPAQKAGFVPVITRHEISAVRVRPGARLAFTWWIKNEGDAPAQHAHRIFVHVEWPKRDCSNIVWQDDHDPALPTTLWAPGREIAVGPRTLQIPPQVSGGKVYVHCGLFADKLPGKPRLVEKYVCTIDVAPDAPVSDPQPKPLPAAEIDARRKALARRMGGRCASLKTEHFEFKLDKSSGALRLLDLRSGAAWHSDPRRNLAAQLTLLRDGKMELHELAAPDAVKQGEGRLELDYSLGEAGSFSLRVLTVKESDGMTGLEFSAAPKLAEGCELKTLNLLPRAFWVTNAEAGELTVPNMLGLQIKAEGSLPWQNLFGTYQGRAGLSMGMVGCHKDGSALLASWNDPYGHLDALSEWVDEPRIPGVQMLSIGFYFTDKARDMSVRVYPLGKGGAPAVARAYRTVARRKGYLVTWKDKARANPNARLMLGCADFKPFVFMRVIPGSRYNRSGKEELHLSYTFQEAAQCAEHLYKDVGIDRAMFVLAGWIHRGYDNQHPDVLPAAPECGGNDALVDCARRVKSLGYLFGMHDNYQDMYKDAPSFDEKWLVRWPGGAVARGGNWAGGQAYQVCSRLQPVLAGRPQNFPSIARLFGPTIYFSDTVFAWPLVECYSNEHPMTRHDDLEAKSQLCALARKHFGLFGSEDGYEWAIPVSDYHEGIIARQAHFDKGRRIPLYQMVYGDCVAAFTHQGDRLTPTRTGYFLDCLLYGEMPVYAFGPHLYFKQRPTEEVPVSCRIVKIEPAGEPGKLNVTYAWRAHGSAAGADSCFIHLVPEEDEKIVIQDDHSFSVQPAEWKVGEELVDGPHEVDTEGALGSFRVVVGLLDAKRQRVPMRGVGARQTRYLLGRVALRADGVSFEPAKGAGVDSTPYNKNEGAVAGMHPTDRLIRNSYEVLTWVGRLTGDLPMTDFCFLTQSGDVAQSCFGDMTITVNYGIAPYTLRHDVELPAHGFLVEHPEFVAFYANSYGGQVFTEPTYLTVRSLDGKPVASSSRLRLYRARGDKRMKLWGRQFEVEGVSVVQQ